MHKQATSYLTRAEAWRRTQRAERRYRLPDIILSGVPVSENRAKVKYRIRRRDGRETMGSAYTPEAEAWIAQAALMARQATQGRAAGVPHPREWPRPLRISMYLRYGRLDVDNPVKVTMDGIKQGLGVDDRNYVYGCLDREAGPQGLRLIIESAPLGDATRKPGGGRMTAHTAGTHALTHSTRRASVASQRAPRRVSAATRPRPTREARMR